METVCTVSLPPGVRSLRCVLLLVAYAWLREREIPGAFYGEQASNL